MTISPIQIARFKAIRRRPYFAPVLYAVRYVEVEGLGTVATDNHGRIYYDPKKIEEWGPDVASAALIHEVGHILRKHGKRAPKDAHHTIWNVAGDCAINCDIAAAGDLQLPPDCCYPSTFGLEDGLLTEQYYKELLDKAEKMRSSGGGKGDQSQPQQGSQQGQGSGSGQPGRGKGAGKARASEGVDPNTAGGGFDGKGCGSGADGQPRPWELPGTSDAVDSKGVEQPARRATAQKIKEHVAQRGTVPGSWSQWADEVLAPPKVDWRKHLQRVLRGTLGVVAGMVDYSYRRVSRRQNSAPDVVLPGFVRPLVRVAVEVDVSGSMPNQWVNDAFAEVRGLAAAAGAAVRLVQVDAAVQSDEVLPPGDRRRLKMHGRGGTDMCVGFRHIFSNRRTSPDVLVVMTDGFTPWPSQKPPRCHVIGLFFTAEGVKGAPSWMTTKILYEPKPAAEGL